MLIVAIGWMYVVLMMAIAEAMSPTGTLLGAFFTLLLYGVGPVALVLYILSTPARKKARALREAQAGRVAAEAGGGPVGSAGSAPQPDGGGHPARDAVAAERKEA